MRNTQLRLVNEKPPQHHYTRDPVRQVFEHWVALMGKMPTRCKLDSVRATAINAALAIGHDVDTLLAAVEGMAADPLADCPAGARDRMRELDWLLGQSSRIERWAEKGDALRVMAQQDEPAAPAPDETAADPAAVAAQRDRLRNLAAQARAGRLWR